MCIRDSTKVLVHVIEVVPSSEDALWEGRSPLGDLDVIMDELRAFNETLATRPAVVVLNKVDLPHVRAELDRLTAEIEGKRGHTLVPISAVTGEGLDRLRDVLGEAVSGKAKRREFWEMDSSD